MVRVILKYRIEIACGLVIALLYLILLTILNTGILDLKTQNTNLTSAKNMSRKLELDLKDRREHFNFRNGSNKRIFYFGITHHTNRAKALACQNTWVKTLPNMHWYSDQPDAELNATVISYERGDTYDLIIFRVLMVWKHVFENHPGYDWYVRLWDDNYLFRERLEALLKTLNPKAPMIVGRQEGSYIIKKPDLFLFISGGPGWVVTQPTLERWFGSGKRSCNIATITERLKRIPPDMKYAEDLHLSMCLETLGIQYVHSDGFERANLHMDLRIAPQDAVDGAPTQYDKEFVMLRWCISNKKFVKCVNSPNKIGIITLHYMGPNDMYDLFNKYSIRKMNGGNFIKHNILEPFIVKNN